MKTCLFLVISLFLTFSVVAETTENKSVKITAIVAPTLYVNHEYTSLFKIEIKNKDSCPPKDNVTTLYNISKDSLVKEDSFTKEVGCSSSASTGSFTPAEVGNYILCGTIINSSVSSFSSAPTCKEFTVISAAELSCDISLGLKTNESIFYEYGQSIEFKPELNNKSFPFVIEYWIEDLFGELLKPRLNTTNTNEKSWKTNIEEQDRVLFLKAIIYPSCHDLNLSNNVVQQMFIVTKNELASPEEEITIPNSTLNITKVSPETASFGSILGVEIEMYKGATDKYSVSVWAEKDGKEISEKTKVHLKNKNTFYKFMLPVQIEPNCNKKIDDGFAQLIVEGLELHTEGEFSLQGINEKLCPEESEKEKSASKNSFQIVDFPTEIKPGENAKVTLEIKNKEDVEFAVWSYLYRGSKCYSCAEGERDENKISFSVEEDETKTVKLLIKADQEMAAGEYNLMVRYNQDGQKTEHSLTEKITVKETEKLKETNQSLALFSETDSAAQYLKTGKILTTEVPDYGGIIVYESTSEKSKKLVSWVLFVAFALLSLVLIFKIGNT